MDRHLKKHLSRIMIFALAVMIFDFLPRFYPVPQNPNSFDGELVVEIQERMSSKLMDLLNLAVYLLGYPILIYGTACLLSFRKAEAFRQYLLVFIISQIAAQVTWLLYPVSPPRLAVEGVRSVRNELAGFTENFNPYPWGSFPSMHAGNGLSCLLFIRTLGTGWTLGWACILSLMVVSTLYLGEHYFLDLLAGFFCSLLAYFLVVRFRLDRRLSFGRLSISL